MMKKILGLASLLLCCSASVEAQNSHPCAIVMSACEAAGYYQGGGAVHKGIWSDCMDVVMKGKVVPGLNVDPNVLSACNGRPVPNPDTAAATTATPTAAGAQQAATPPLQDQKEVAKFMLEQRSQVQHQGPPPKSQIFTSPEN